MRVKINAPKIIQVKPSMFDEIAKGNRNRIKNHLKVKISDRIRIREHTGKYYTGKEVLATVSKVTPKSITFKKICIIDQEEEGKQNQAGARKYNFERGGV